MNFIFKLVLTFNATSLLAILFFIQKEIVLPKFEFLPQWFTSAPDFLSYLIYIAFPIVLTKVSLNLASFLGVDEFVKGDVVSVEHANNSFLPSYLGYFFVALSIASTQTFYFVYGMLFVFTFLSQALYFNPLFLLFGYEFYNVKTKAGATIFLISKEKYKIPSEVQTSRAARINNYTFIDLE